MVNTCALYGSFTNANNWIGINYLVIIVGFSIVAAIYMLSKITPQNTSAKLTGITKIEITQLMISALLVAVLIASATTVCNIATSISTAVNGNPYGPFTLADSYIGSLVYNKGIGLLSNIYTLSITYYIYANLLTMTSSSISSFIPKTELAYGNFNLKITFGYDAGISLGILSTVLLAVFAPLVIISLGMLFLQYLLLPIIQYTMFTIALPIAIGMRSIAFAGAGGTGLRGAANSILAIAIALYLIYPLVVGFDAYIMHWMFSPQNPSYTFLESTYSHPTAPVSTFLLTTGTTGFGSTSWPSISSIFKQLTQGNFLAAIDFSEPAIIVNDVSEFMFQAVVLFALNIAITIGFAMSLAKALNGGIEGAASFWSNI